MSFQSFDTLLCFCDAAAICARIKDSSLRKIAAHAIGLPNRQGVWVIGLGEVELGSGAARLHSAFEPKAGSVDVALKNQRVCTREQFVLTCFFDTTRRIARRCGRHCGVGLWHGTRSRMPIRTSFTGTLRSALTAVILRSFRAGRRSIGSDDPGGGALHPAYLLVSFRQIAIRALRP